MAGKLTHVSVKQGAGHNLVLAAEFARLPINQRIEIVLQGRAVFLDDDGKTMGMDDAIAQLTSLAMKR